MTTVLKAAVFCAAMMSAAGTAAFSQDVGSSVATQGSLSTFKSISFGVKDPNLTEVPLWVNRMARIQGFSLIQTGVSKIDITGFFRELQSAAINQNPVLSEIVNLNFEYAQLVTIENNALLGKITNCNFGSASTVKITKNPALAHIDCMSKMSMVEILHLNDNDLDNNIWKSWSANSPALELLNLSGNPKLTELHEGLVSSSIRNLNISGTGIEKIPAFLPNLISLKTVQMHNSCISKAEYAAFRRTFIKTGPNSDGIEQIFPDPHSYAKGPHCTN